MMRRPTLELTEYVTERAVDLTLHEANELRAAFPSLTISLSWDVPGAFDVTPGAEVGVVALTSRTVIVRPKVLVDRVLFLLSYAMDPVRWQDRAATYADAPDLVQGMAALYGLELRKALRRGVLQGYRTEEDSLTTLRGRVRFDEQLRRRYGANTPIEVRFDEFTTDTDLNRLLLAALHRLSHHRIRSPAVRRTLGFCSALLSDGVAAVEMTPDTIPSIVWNRLNQHLRPAAELAELIIRFSSIEMRDGARRAPGLVVDMNVVFEAFVRVALRESLGLTERSFPDGHHARPGGRGTSVFLDDGRRVRLKPDLSWWRGRRCVFVGDVKYKRINPAGVRHADIYQLLAYATAFDLPAGLLIYADGEAESVEHVVVPARKRLQVHRIGLDGAPEEILSRVASLAARIRSLAMEATPAGTNVEHTTGIGRGA